MHQTVDMHTAINKINVPDFVRDVRGPHECKGVRSSKPSTTLHINMRREPKRHMPLPQTLSNLKT
jgi:hypothetical protein